MIQLSRLFLFSLCLFVLSTSAFGQRKPARTGEYSRYAIYHATAPRAKTVAAQTTKLPLELKPGTRIALIGNGLLEQSQKYGQLEALLHQRYPSHELIVRNLAWSADTADIQPRPANFADADQHLTHEKADVVFVAFGFNESFAGEKGVEAFKKSLSNYVANMKTKAFNGEKAPQIVLFSPVANENVEGVPAADLNNANIKLYAEAIRDVAAEQEVGFVDVYESTLKAMRSLGDDLTNNGSQLNKRGYDVFANAAYQGLFGEAPPKVNELLASLIQDKNRQYFRRFRPLNTFYYTGDRNKSYGYLDFLPAMRNFDIMVANREQRISEIAQGKSTSLEIDDSNLPPLPKTPQSRGANEWMSAKDEFKAFKIDPRFDVTLFAGEEEFPDMAAPIQMRWDSQGRLWVACSKTYPHVYPGNEPDDKLVILEDTDGDGKADKSTVFADDLHIPLSFEFGDGGVYVSEMPDLTFIKDTDGDGKADYRRTVFSGFGTEDSHHSLHDFAWTPDGDLIFRESIFHHSQVETPYGPVRQQNSGWFRYQPRDQRLTSFGTYHSTNPWGVTFDDWGRHQASHPVFAAAFHSLDPPFPTQHPRPSGLQAYSGVCGTEFVDFASWPKEMQGDFIRVRYKPTNRVEIHHWEENEFGFNEKYVSDLLFSTNLSFIPVDLRSGPRGAMYICDWYNPIKGHAQYSLRDERRDRHSGRIWRVTTKGKPLTDPPKIAGASIGQLLDNLKRPEYRYRYWTRREIRERNADEVFAALNDWVGKLDSADPRYRHHQMEAIWAYRNIDRVNADLLRELLSCEHPHAREAATQQLRYWHVHLPDHIKLLRRAANDTKGLVRMEAAIAASYIGTPEALDALMDVFQHPLEGHLAYAATCALGSHTLKPHWEGNASYDVDRLLKQAQRSRAIKEPPATGGESQFDAQKNLKTVRVNCVSERMKFSVEQIAVTTGQAVKIVFANGDATDHNMVFVKPGTLAEVGMAANEMAKDPAFANSDFIPKEKKSLILHASPMIGPTRKSRVHVFRFKAPTEPGVYPYVCTFPGHWVIMKGNLVVVNDLKDVKEMVASQQPKVVAEWKLADFADLAVKTDDETVMAGMQAFSKARCNQCHVVKGHGIHLGPDLTEVSKTYKGEKLLRQILEPSHEINKKFQTHRLILNSGKVLTGFIRKETPTEIELISNLLLPERVTRINPKDVDERSVARISSMPEGMLNVLTKEEIQALVSFLEAGGFKLPAHLEGKHSHGSGHGTN